MGRNTIKSEIYKDLPKPSILLYNITENTPIFSTGADVQRPLSSLTKLMTAVTVMESGGDLTQVFALSTSRAPDVIPMQQYTRLDLLKALLVYSDNSAAETLAENHPGGRDQFLQEMNAKAISLGMNSTNFLDPHGHDSQSQSSAIDLLALVKYTITHYPLLSSISVLDKLEFAFDDPLVSVVDPANINITLLNEFNGIILSKTGRSVRSGYCYAMAISHNNCNYGLIMLGSPTHEVKEAYTRKLIHNYITRPFEQVK